METQYGQFTKNGGKFIIQQITRRKEREEKKYEIKRELLVAALFYQDYVKQHIENEKTRNNLL